ncbi:unnamed protein product [Rotaria magnacalcarata]
MPVHEDIFLILIGYSCDYCSEAEFEGFRYNCTICSNYDLCSACYENGKVSLQHSNSHPMICIQEPEETLSGIRRTLIGAPSPLYP